MIKLLNFSFQTRGACFKPLLRHQNKEVSEQDTSTERQQQSEEGLANITINAFDKTAHSVFTSRDYKAFGLGHVDFFFQVAIQEGRLHIKLDHVEVKGSYGPQNGSKTDVLDHRGECFFIVHSVLLGEPFGN